MQDYAGQMSRAGVPMGPASEGWWAVLLTVILVATAIGTGTLLGIGTWRVVHDKAPLADLKDDSALLQANASTLYDEAQAFIVPENCTVYVGNQTQPNEYPSDEFFVFSASDSDLQLDFDTSALSSTDRFLQIQNVSGIVAYLANVTGLHGIFVDATFRLRHAADSTKEASIDLGGMNPMQLLTLSIQSTGGTIAYLGDIPTQITDYADDEFLLETWEPTDNMTLAFDASAIGSGLTQILTVQDKSGTIVYLSDITPLNATRVDDTFAVYDEDSITSKTRFDLSGLGPSSNVTLTFQGRSGTIAYVGDVPPPGFTEVDIIESRQFPDMAHENATTLQDLGVSRMQVTMCGGGGPGSSICTLVITLFNARGMGGGSGGGVEGLYLDNVGALYESVNITIGEGGISFLDPDAPILGVGCQRGGDTVFDVKPLVSGGPGIRFVGYGGNCVDSFIFSGQTYYGGCGGGSAGYITNTNDTKYPWGAPGSFGGVEGTCGSVTPQKANTPPFRFPWRGGGHGSYRFGNPAAVACYDPDEPCVSSDTINGGQGGLAEAGLNPAGGAGGMFGPGGTPSQPDAMPNTCAGGGAAVADSCAFSGDVDYNFGRGGSGRVVIRYWI